MTDVIFWQNICYFLIAFSLCVYSLLDGFDLGIGISLPFLGKTKQEKKTIINIIGPFWDGNEVWLFIVGSAIFTVAPIAFGTILSGYYLVFMTMIFCLIFRATSFEFHKKSNSLLWERVFFIASVCTAIILGIAMGVLLAGIPLNEQREFTGTLKLLLRPLPLIAGVLCLSTFFLHGLAFASLKADGEILSRIFNIARKICTVNGIFIFVYLVLLVNTYPNAIIYKLSVFGIALLIISFILLIKGIYNNKSAMFLAGTSCIIIGLWIITSSMFFPNIVRSISANLYSITIYNSSSSVISLKIFSVFMLIGIPVILIANIFLFYVFRKTTK